MKLVAVAGVVLLFAYSQAGFAQESPSRDAAAPQTPRTHSIRKPVRTGAAATAATSASLPTWTGKDGTYSYTMVGQSPVTTLASPATTIPVEILPVALVFSDGTTLNPATVDATCSPAGSALTLLEGSPLFNNYAYTVGGTSVGTTTYHDFFQRANLWQYTSPTGVNPNYHVLFSPSPHAVTTLTVPAADGSTIAGTCGRFGRVSLTWFDAWVENTLIPAQGVVPSQFAVVLLYNAGTYEPPNTTPLILGYHSGFSNTATGGAIQYYAVGDFDTTKLFGTIQDTADLSHEIGEWMDDPIGTNPTPPYGNTGEVTSGCQDNLEVGDPLSGTDITVTMPNSYVYHLQELTFFGWFFHNSPSTSLNGWYSSNGTFKTYAAACPAATPVTTATTITLSLSSTTVTAGASVTATIAVKAASGTTVPTGSVALVTSTGTTLGTFTLSGGSAGGSVTLPAGTYTVTAEYGGSSTFTASNSNVVSVVSATAVATTTTMTLSATTVTTTAQVTVSIAVKAASGTATPTGTAALVSSTGTTLASFTLAGGAASGSLTLPAGTYTVTAKYAGAGDFTASSSAAVSVTSTATVATTTTLKLSSATVTAGAGVTATVAVKATSGTASPAGTVALVSSTGSTLATLTLASGAASGSVVLPSGNYTVTAKYAGSAAFTASNSTAVSVVSTLIPTTTTLSLNSTALPSGGADAATITVKPASGTGTPTGTVALVSSAGTKIATLSLTSGAYSGSVNLPSGSYTVTAEYSGDTTDAASNSAVVTINPAPVLALSPTSLSFASTTVGSAAATQTITVTNKGSGALTSPAISESGTDPADFTWTTTCGASLAVNASCSVVVTFKPAATGTRTATLTIATSTVALKGTAVAAPVSKSTGSRPVGGRP